MEWPSMTTIKVVIVVIFAAIILISTFTMFSGLYSLYTTISTICCILDILGIFFPSLIVKIGDKTESTLNMIIPGYESLDESE